MSGSSSVNVSRATQRSHASKPSMFYAKTEVDEAACCDCADRAVNSVVATNAFNKATKDEPRIFQLSLSWVTMELCLSWVSTFSTKKASESQAQILRIMHSKAKKQRRQPRHQTPGKNDDMQQITP